MLNWICHNRSAVISLLVGALMHQKRAGPTSANALGQEAGRWSTMLERSDCRTGATRQCRNWGAKIQFERIAELQAEVDKSRRTFDQVVNRHRTWLKRRAEKKGESSVMELNV